MGVPKFYRWMSERYPCLSETVKEFQIPEFDNLYLDMNGIIHICSHPEDDNPHFRITEEKIFSDIFHYIEFLFRIIKPRKVFYMAVDGVAPRAKMNQQRGRRFRSAREAEDLIKKAQEKGEVLPTEKRFDSNCITPGTEFMVRLQEQLKYFVVQKISTDPLWQGPEVYLSGHETPGEGEHKVMDFIRYEKSQPGYDPNTRHCLYGLDADLIVLGLATHEPHFSLLREEVRFGGKRERNKRPSTPEETTFHLLHLSLLREYLDYEFSALRKKKLPFPYDVEGIIDDWILMGFLVGNDFIPHLPNLHINHDALPYLWRTYEEVLPSLDGYLNEGGHLNLKRFEKYLEALAKFDIEKFSDQFTDMKWMESKLGKKHVNEAAAKAAQEENERKKERKKSFNDTNPFAALEGVVDEFDPSLSDSGADTFTEPTEETTLSDLSDDDVDTFAAEFRQHKRNYYMDKLDYHTVTPEVLQDQARGYVTAIQWILLYYFEGVPSWSWFYPHHYAPYISDVKDFSDMKMEFHLGKPFLPFQQLMAVLPAASKDLLPEAFRGLMTMDTSPIIDFYPVNFKTDLNGKQQDWEAVVLIPFIKEERLLETMQPKYDSMTKAESARNKHGPSTVFVYDEERQEPYLSRLPGIFPDINVNHTRQEEIPLELYRVDGNKLKKGVLPEVRLDVYFPGFPTLFHIKHSAVLKKEGVKVFQMNSRGENMILTITQSEDLNMPIEEASHIYLGNSVYVGWPHLHEAKVIEVSDGETSYKLLERKGEKGKKPSLEKIRRDLQKDESAVWRSEAGSIKERSLYINILLHALPMTGRRYVCGSHGKITLEKQFCVRPVPYALQATVKDIAIHDPDFQQFRTLEQLFSPETSVFMIGHPHYGCQGEVLDVEDGRVRMNVGVPVEPDMTNVMRRQESLETNYMPGYMIAQRLGISGLFLSRLTGSILVIQGSRDNPKANKINVGLNLKHTKRNQELPGYTRKLDDRWTYSQATFELVRDYIDKFHEVMQVLSAGGGGGDLMSEEEIFPPNSCISKQTSVEGEIIPSMRRGTLRRTSNRSAANAHSILSVSGKRQHTWIPFRQTHSSCLQYHVRKEKHYSSFVRHTPLRGLRKVPAHVNFRNKRGCLLLSVSCLTTGALHYRNRYEYKLKHMIDFVRNLPCNNVKPLSTGADILEEGVVKAIEEEVDRVNEENRRKQKKVKMQVKPHLLFRPLINQGPLVPDQTATYWLYDRVVAVKLGYPVPLGLRGTVVGIHPDEKESDTLYDVVFDAEFIGGINVRSSPNRGYRVPAAAMINLTHGERKEKKGVFTRRLKVSVQPYSWGQGSGANLNTNHSYSDLMSKSGGHRGRAKEPHMLWGSADRRPNHKHDQFDSSQKQQDKYNYYNGSDSFNKGFGQKNGGFTSNNPQFVTPKVTQTQFSKRTPNRTQQTGGKTQPSQDATSNSEFANMWKELQAGTVQTAPSSGNLIQEPSLQQAALALGQITPPTTRHQKKPELSGRGDSVNESENGSSKKIDLQTLFDRASLQKEAAEKDEFIAMMDSLELSGKTQKEEEVVGGINSNNNATEQDGSSALKHMLKIGSDTSTTPEGGSVPNTSSPTKAYGKQLSVQELFDGAKQQETSPPQPKQQQQEHQQQQQQQQQHQQKGQDNWQQQGQGQRPHQQQGQRKQHQGQGHVNHRPHDSGPRLDTGNPVLDLEGRCKNLGLSAPGYDFKRAKGLYTSMVMLTNGARFEGSECGSREEAAESAASIALLHLFTLEWQIILQALDRTQPRPFMNIPPPGMMMPPPPHLCSPNSAFSPVRPGAAQMFVPRGGYSQLRHPRHQFPGPPQPQRYQGHGHHQHGGVRQHHPANQNAGSGSWNHHQGNQSDMGLGGSYHSSEASRKPGMVTDPAFIPLQVARNQKTPQKRRDTQSQYHEDNSAAPVRDSDSFSRSENKQTDSSQSQSGSYSALRTDHPKSHKSEPKSAGGPPSQGKKRRPRIAANLNFS
ncbi:LOW QUALITY PROTEIN: 5'-3' exoribonuclease 1-like [Haliotis rubra]|uniref:LOW QUALITY PROTEIN: 5'-3' exoribonuclease 1-like n=1 Tax=Haliotis rubra TaxID=36100 RepID=UPI001EE5DC4A|nr:LOW QUALITY PROTEIN: 5'-3' exoribonuclease 1-like [Haliotis rubra]